MTARPISLAGIPAEQHKRGLCLQCMSRVCVHLETPVNLTPREMDVARLLAGGLSDKEIAGLLGLTVNTVKVMNSRLFDKLRLTSRLEVALWARDHAKLLGVPGIYGQAVNQ